MSASRRSDSPASSSSLAQDGKHEQASQRGTAPPRPTPHITINTSEPISAPALRTAHGPSSRGRMAQSLTASGYDGADGVSSLSLQTDTKVSSSMRSPTSDVTQSNTKDTTALMHADPPPSYSDDDMEPGANGPFSFTKAQLHNLVDPKSIAALRALGGLEGLMDGLCSTKDGLDANEKTVTTANTGRGRRAGGAGEATAAPSLLRRTTTTLSLRLGAADDSFIDRKRVYGENKLPPRHQPSLLELFWNAMKDRVIILLSICAVISLAIGLYETLGEPAEYDPITHKRLPEVEWVEGVAIVVAILLVTVVGSVNDWTKERQFTRLSKKVDNYSVNVIRSGNMTATSVHDVVVGDILAFDAGDVLCADGVLVEGRGVKTDESGVTGESDQIRKTPASTCLQDTPDDVAFDRKRDPFMISGSQVLEGNGQMLITSVGVNSFNGRTMMAMRVEAEITPLQLRLGRIADVIAKAGGSAAIILFLVLFIRFCAMLPSNDGTPSQKGQEFMKTVIIAVTLLVVAVPEGLPLAVTLALAFATKRMQRDNNLVRVLRACETMGNATTVCSDKTGTLTQNRMTVVAGAIGSSISGRFFDRSSKEPIREKGDTPTKDGEEEDTEFVANASSSRDAMMVLSTSARRLILESIALNTTAHEVSGEDAISDPSQEQKKRGSDRNKPGNEAVIRKFMGSKTECALLDFAVKNLGLENVNSIRNEYEVAQVFPFSSDRKAMGIVIAQGDEFVFFAKGMPEKLIEHCTQVLDGEADLEGVATVPYDNKQRESTNRAIHKYASESLRTLGLSYRRFQSWPPPGARLLEGSQTEIEWADAFDGMTFIGVVGIMDPIRPDVPAAVAACVRAGVVVRMVTGDNPVTAEAIAKQCGIIKPGGIIMDGPKFRSLDPADRMEILPNLQVLARSSPMDKQILVQALKDLGNVVAVTGDGTNDGPALKRADVGFSMGLSGTEVAKEASDIILLDDNFSSIVKALLWGRAVNDAVKKFLQFQLTVNVGAVLLTFITSVASSEQSSVLTAVQLLWVNLIMDTLAALALATDPPVEHMLDRKPESKNSSLISFDMWKMILCQAAFQLIVTLVLHFRGNKIFNYDPDSSMMSSIVFNAFVWMQIFNEVNNRKINQELNIFEGLHHNYLFMLITVIMVGAQVLIVYVGGATFSVTRIDGKGWAISIVLGVLSLPIGVIVRLIPNSFVRKVVPIQTALAIIAFIEKCFSLPGRLLRKKKRNNGKGDVDSDLETNSQGGLLGSPTGSQLASPNDVVDLLQDSLGFILRIRKGRYRPIFRDRRPVLKLPNNSGFSADARQLNLRMRTGSTSTVTSVALMLPVSTLLSDASSRLTPGDVTPKERSGPSDTLAPPS